jgi:hypothetical protein
METRQYDGQMGYDRGMGGSNVFLVVFRVQYDFAFAL